MRDEVCSECGTYGRRETHAELCWGKLRLRESLADLGVDGRKITTTIIIIIIIIIIELVHNYTSTYARIQGYNWTKNTCMNMCQNQ